MTVELFANSASSTLNGAIDNVQTTLVVTSASLFPAAVAGLSQFRLLCETELMLVTLVAGTTFTIVRGIEGTTAASHADTTAVYCIVTQGALQQLKADAQGWITALDFDFTAYGTVALATDTTYTIGGLTWKKVNSTSDNVPMGLSTLNGLRQQPKGDGSNYNETNFSAAGLQINLAQIIPNLAFGMQVRIWAHNSGNNAAANYDSGTLTLENPPHSNYLLVRGYASGQYLYLSMGNNGTAPGGVAADTQNLSNDVYVLTVPCFGEVEASSKTGLWSSGWPAANTLRSQASVKQTAITPGMATPADWNIGLYGIRANSGTALVIDWKHLRVDYRA